MREYGVAAVDRALDVLGAFQQGTGALTLADLVRLTGVNKTTVLRVCSSLERRGYVRRDGQGRWALGPAACVLGKHYEANIHLEDVLIPALLALSSACAESASFHVRSGGVRLCIYRVDADHSVVDNVHTGDTLPLELGAPGKVLLAWSSDAPIELEQVRTKGYAISFGDRDPQCAAVSVPVFRLRNELCGALSVSGPKTRFTPRYARAILPRVVTSAAQVSAALGAAAPSVPAVHRPAPAVGSARAARPEYH